MATLSSTDGLDGHTDYSKRYNLLYRRAKESQAEKAALREQAKDDELKECTWQPTITKRPVHTRNSFGRSQAPESNSGGKSSRFDSLYQDSQARQARARDRAME